MDIAVDPLPCGEISRVAFIGTSLQIDAATFQGWRDFEMRRDFEEIRYLFKFPQWWLPSRSTIHLVGKQKQLLHDRFIFTIKTVWL